jgi:SAM-dependent methyltransferase
MPGSQVPQDRDRLPGDAVYALGSDPGERVRLQRQSDELRPYAVAILDRVGIGPGQAVVDVGCGPSGILELLAERTSPGGRVVGLDIDPANVAMATELVRERRLAGVEVRAGVFPAGHSRRTIRLELIRSMRPKIIGFGLAGERELDELDRAAREHLSDPRTLLMSYLYFLAWGRKPADR